MRLPRKGSGGSVGVQLILGIILTNYGSPMAQGCSILSNRCKNRVVPTSFPGSTPLSRWRPREDPGTHRCTPREILQESWSILSRDTIEFRFRYT